jgi:hypothetical protein
LAGRSFVKQARFASLLAYLLASLLAQVAHHHDRPEPADPARPVPCQESRTHWDQRCDATAADLTLDDCLACKFQTQASDLTGAVAHIVRPTSQVVAPLAPSPASSCALARATGRAPPRA